MLNETAPPVIDQPILDELARHLKLPEAPLAEANSEAESALRAAIAHLEAQLGLALIERSFVWQGRVGGRSGVSAPMTPISSILSAQRQDSSDETTEVETSSITLDQSGLRTQIMAKFTISEPIVLTFIAGFGPNWTDTPAGLRHACFMLAAHYFDTRHDVGDAGNQVPHGVAALVAAWRPLRLTIGARP